jgi:hypothetical protein
VLAALNQINWGRADGVGSEDYDLFERDKWPLQDLNFAPWRTMIWAQGEEAGGIAPEERAALKAMLNAGDVFNRKNLIIAGQEVARVHDVALTASNGSVADQDFVRNYLRAQYIGNTVPADYSNRKIRGVRITPGKYELLAPTGVAGDLAPTPSVLRMTSGAGLAGASHAFTDQSAGSLDTNAGMVSTASVYNTVYYAFDWRHAGRFAFEPTTSGARRLVLGALDYIDQFKGILPVKLASFDAYQSGRQTVTVDWKTTSETDISGMEIERAQVTRTETGIIIGEYTVIDHKVPSGSATSGATYSVVDHGVQSGREYSYRLVSVSLEGVRSAAAEPKQVLVGSSSQSQYSLTVAPNPVISSGVISYVVPSGEAVRVVLYDAVGRQVSVLSAEASGTGSVVLPVSELASGTYTVRLEGSSGTVLTEKVTVQK